MKITHLGHAAVLVEAAGKRILIDPGSFSEEWHAVTGLDAILVTHQRPGHVEPDNVPRLVAASSQADGLAEPSVGQAHGLPHARPLASGERARVGEVEISAVGGEHASIHRDIPRIGNIGLLLRAEGEPTLFHPGDSLAACPEGVDVLALPIMGPWAALKEHIDFVRQIGAPQAFPIHDRLLSERGWQLATSRLQEMSDTEVHDWRDGQPHEV